MAQREVRDVEQRRPARCSRLEDFEDGLQEMSALRAQMSPGIWPLARALDSVRRHDKAAEQTWQDREASRLAGCREVVARLEREGTLDPHVDPAVAADLLWTLASLRTWEDLVLIRGWSARDYEARLADLFQRAVVRRF